MGSFSATPDYVGTITSEIGQQETNSGSAGVGLSLNNPAALKYAPWEANATPGPNGFAKFQSLQDGWNAAMTRVAQLVSGGASISSLINTWAPPSDNNTNNAARVNQIANATGLNPSQPINSQTSTTVPYGDYSPNDPLSPFAGADGTVGSNGSGTYTAPPAQQGLLSTFSWSRIGAFAIGAIALIVGLVMLKQTQTIIENVSDKVGKAASVAAIA